MSNPTEEMLRWELEQMRKEIEQLKAERDLLQALVDTMINGNREGLLQ